MNQNCEIYVTDFFGERKHNISNHFQFDSTRLISYSVCLSFFVFTTITYVINARFWWWANCH